MLKRVFLASLAVFGLIATGCTPEQLAYLNITADQPAYEPLLALDDNPVPLGDGSTLELDGSVTPAPPTTAPPANPGPPPSSFSAQCPQYDHLLVRYAPTGGWDAARMSRYMKRESNCVASVRSRTSDSGLLQINDVNHAYLRRVLGEWVDRYTLMDPVQNVRAAAALCAYWRSGGGSCYRPWA